MSTKVKGDKIKEGSIPLSALDDKLKNEIDCKYGLGEIVSILNSNNTTSDILNFGYYFVYVSSKNTIIQLNISGETELSQLGGPSTIITGEVIGGHSVKFSVSGSGMSFYGDLIIGRKYNKPPQETPDWNAQEGEAGYIENRTHGIRWYNKPEDSNFNNLLLGLKNKTPEITIEDSFTKATYKQVNELEDMALNGFKFFEKNWSYDTSYDYVYRFTDNFAIFAGTYGSFDVGWDDNDDIYITIQWNNEEEIKDVNIILNGIDDYYYVIDATNFEISTLDSAYIPNTVVKTTPQTLSNTAKNQALANLGIERFFRKIKEKCILNIQYDELHFDDDEPNLVTGYGGGLDDLIKDIKSFLVNCYYYNEIGKLSTERGKFTCTEMLCRELINVNSNDVNDYNITNFDISFGTSMHNAADYATQFQIHYDDGKLIISLFEL